MQFSHGLDGLWQFARGRGWARCLLGSGMVSERCLAFGASMPWNRIRLSLGRGTKAEQQSKTKLKYIRFEYNSC